MANCIQCDKVLTSDDIGLTKKLINRGTTQFLCKTCLAQKFKVSEELLNQKITEYKNMGCLLFK